MRFELGIKVLSPTHNSKSVEIEAFIIEINVSKEIVNITIIIFFLIIIPLKKFFYIVDIETLIFNYIILTIAKIRSIIPHRVAKKPENKII